MQTPVGVLQNVWHTLVDHRSCHGGGPGALLALLAPDLLHQYDHVVVQASIDEIACAHVAKDERIVKDLRGRRHGGVDLLRTQAQHILQLLFLCLGEDLALLQSMHRNSKQCRVIVCVKKRFNRTYEESYRCANVVQHVC